MDNQSQEIIAKLETHIDMIETELYHLHELLLQCGFSEGVISLKQTIQEYLSSTPNSFESN